MHLLVALLLLAAPQDRDGDGDGLSDFQETHKYFTDPAKADSDGDGTPDGDWDEGLRAQLIAELKESGVDPGVLDDRQLVESASAHLMKRAKFNKGFTTFFVHFPDGKVSTFDGLEEAVESNRIQDMSLSDQWERELSAKGMFKHRTHGSCTSSSIYLSGCLRALGIPTRTILCIPVIDASDPLELQMVRRLHHRVVRGTIIGALERSRTSWSSHTFNEVWVGGRWRRLNYQKLGQNILDRNHFGLMTHILTVRDWADANAAPTVGRRQGTQKRENDPFGYANPYSTLTVTDRFGKHSKIVPPSGHERLTITDLIWYDSERRPKSVTMNLHGDSGHLLFKVKENFAGEGDTQYQPFYDKAGREFLLRAEGQEDVRAQAERGFWGNGWFYMRIAPEELARMAEGVPYVLSAADEAWQVSEGVVILRP